MIQKLSRQELLELVSQDIPHISENDKDKMAIPSYLHKNPLIRWLMWKRYEEITNLACFSEDMTVLEFGCGAGVFLPELDRTCGKVYAIDIFPEYAKLLSKKLFLKVSLIDKLSKISDGSLDVIIAADVLEHIVDVDEYLAQFRDKLKNEGRLIVSGPTENPIYKIGRILAGFDDKGDYHLTNINNLIERIKEAGFVLVNLRTLPFVFPPYLFKVCEFQNA